MPKSARLMTAVMLAVLGAVCAWWGIALAYPSHDATATSSVARSAPQRTLGLVAARFAGQAAVAAPVDARLLGVVSGGAGSRAVVMSQGKPATLAVGDTVSPGVTLAEIGPDYIEVSTGPARQRIELATPTKPGKGAKP